MKYILTVIFAITAIIATAQTTDLVDWVNPLMGTDSKPSLSNGNTYPIL